MALIDCARAIALGVQRSLRVANSEFRALSPLTVSGGSTVVVLQPSYIPWLGYLNQMMRSDHFVLLDTVPFDKNGWRNRNRILFEGERKWLTVPVRQSGRFGQQLSDVEIAESRWATRHIQTIKQAYRQQRGLEEVLEIIQPILEYGHSSLVDLNAAILTSVSGRLGFSCKFHRASAFAASSERSQRLIDICMQLGASTYLSGAAAKSYLDLEKFETANIEVRWQEFVHVEYPQCAPTFVSHLSFIDAASSVGLNGLLPLLGNAD